MANWKAYRKLKEESENMGWPMSYKTDLTKHDRRALSRKDAPDAFVWLLRDYGTHMYPMNNANALLWAAAARKTWCNNTRARWYVYDAPVLLPVAPIVAFDKLAQSCVGMPVHVQPRNASFFNPDWKPGTYIGVVADISWVNGDVSLIVNAWDGGTRRHIVKSAKPDVFCI